MITKAMMTRMMAERGDGRDVEITATRNFIHRITASFDRGRGGGSGIQICGVRLCEPIATNPEQMPDTLLKNSYL